MPSEAGFKGEAGYQAESKKKAHLRLQVRLHQPR